MSNTEDQPNTQPYEWPEVIGFDDNSGPSIPARLLPEPYASFASALAKETETPEEMSVAAILGVIALLAAPKTRVTITENHSEPVNVYMMCVARPGERKSSVINACTAPLLEHEDKLRNNVLPKIKDARSKRALLERCIEEKRKEAAKAKTDFERDEKISDIQRLEQSLPPIPAMPQLFTTDSTPEGIKNKLHEQNGHFAVIADEGGIIDVMGGLYNNGNANIDVLLQGIDGGQVRIDRKGEESMMIRPHLVFVLFVQPVVIQNMATKKTYSGRGFLERFLYVVPKSSLGYRTHTTASMPQEIKQSYFKAIQGLIDDMKDMTDTAYLLLSSEAQNEWHAFRIKIEALMLLGEALSSDEKRGWASKLPGFIARIAGLLHLMKHGVRSNIIDLASMRAALEIGSLFVNHATVAFSMMRELGLNKEARKTWEFITSKANGEISRQDLITGLRNHSFGRAEELDQVIKELIDRGLIREEKRITTGRHGKFYILNSEAIKV